MTGPHKQQASSRGTGFSSPAPILADAKSGAAKGQYGQSQPSERQLTSPATLAEMFCGSENISGREGSPTCRRRGSLEAGAAAAEAGGAGVEDTSRKMVVAATAVGVATEGEEVIPSML